MKFKGKLDEQISVGFFSVLSVTFSDAIKNSFLRNFYLEFLEFLLRLKLITTWLTRHYSNYRFNDGIGRPGGEGGGNSIRFQDVQFNFIIRHFNNQLKFA